ncbi:MAG: pyridoxal phosphate-dependent aminotransferase [Planctomycetota bacterium]|nr:MAG: pyridoxal phosphate-dependent aminotransferase [Planctomycetota bacterium]
MKVQEPETQADESTRGALREVPFMGVIWVVHEASKRGFWNGHPDWCNLGQGQPEVGPMEGAPPRISDVHLEPADHAYGPLGGTDELRDAIAAHYNRLYRAGKQPYTRANVAVAQGGRLALTRAAAVLAPGTIGYQLPDYTAYEDMLELHLARITPVALRTRESDGFRLRADDFERSAVEQGLRAFLFSNPCNPTGNVVAGAELAELVAICRARRVTLLSDEFYSHFHYTTAGEPAAGPVSAAAFVDDVERDPILIVDGLTKSFRYPGWRVGWAVGPRAMIDSLSRGASSIDGGPSRIAQRAALQALEPARADQETTALRKVFARKRNLMVERLERMGIRCQPKPLSTFYCWASLENLPGELSDSRKFFWAALERKVMTVPGPFFDVNPGKRRGDGGESPYRQWMRFSFGPSEDNLRLGLDRLAELVRGA